MDFLPLWQPHFLVLWVLVGLGDDFCRVAVGGLSVTIVF